MTFLPVVERELRIASRLNATYRNRALTAALVALVAVLMMLAGSLSGASASVGRGTFSMLAHLTLVFCLFEGVRKTADCLSEEKREGTLGLLFLTDLKGYDVVFGKLAAMSLNSFYGLMAILPVLALPFMMGGVLSGEYWRMVLALGNILFFSLSAGLWVSSLCRLERRAMGGTVLMIGAVAALPLFSGRLELFPLSPLYAFRTAFAALYDFESGAYWESIAITQLMCWLLLAWAALATPRTWQDRVVTTARARRWQPGDAASRAKKRTVMLDRNPAFWLAARNLGPRTLHWLFSLVLGLGAAAAIFTSGTDGFVGLVSLVFLLNFMLKMRVASHASRCLAEARRNNALEMLLSTPLTVDEIIRGQILGLKYLFLVPVGIILALEAAGLFGAVILAADKTHGPLAGILMVLVLGLIALGMFVLDILAVTWAGMWFGLSSRKEGQAAVKTILVVLVAPLLSVPFVYLCFIGIPIFVVWPIFWMVWARSQVRLKFRELAAQRYVLKPADPGWMPGAAGQGTTVAPPLLPG